MQHTVTVQSSAAIPWTTENKEYKVWQNHKQEQELTMLMLMSINMCHKQVRLTHSKNQKDRNDFK